MLHYDEHTLELYTLGEGLDETSRGEIAAHLRECRGCAQLASQIEQFYLLAERALATQKPPEHRMETALARRQGDLEHIPGERGALSPTGRIRSFLFRYPVASSATAIVATAILAASLVIGIRGTGRDTNPFVARVDAPTSMFQVFNAVGNMLWQRPLRNTDYGPVPERRFAVTDLDGDGENEVVTTLPLLLDGKEHAMELRLFSGADHVMRTVKVGHPLTYRGREYHDDFSALKMLVDSTIPGQRPNIFVVVQGGRSPGAVVRLDNGGKTVGEYWNFGTIEGMFQFDVNGDGTSEIVIYGRDDTEEEGAGSHPFIAALDPERLTGLTEAGPAAGFGYGRSVAEIAYIRLPRTDLNAATYSQPVVWWHDVASTENATIFRFQVQGAQPGKMDFEYLFTADLRPVQVKSTTWTENLVRRLRGEGKVVGPIDAGYLSRLKDSIQRWNGTGWIPSPAAADSPDRP